MGAFDTNLFNTTQFNSAGSAAAPGAPPALTGGIYVSDILYAAYRISGVLPEAQRGMSASQSIDGLLWLNGMVGTWQSERLMVYAILRKVFTPALNKGSEENPYTIGLDTTQGQPDFFIQRPEQINGAGFIFTNVAPNIEIPIAVLNDQQWKATSPKDLSGPIVTRLYYRPLVPNGNILVWMVPNTAFQIALYTWQTVSGFQTAQDLVVIPPAYQEALEYNLAVRIAGIHPNRQKMAQASFNLAASSLRKIKTINAPLLLAQCERAALGSRAEGHYNIISNQYE